MCSGPGSGLSSGKERNGEGNKRESPSFLAHKLLTLIFFYTLYINKGTCYKNTEGTGEKWVALSTYE